MATHVYKLKAEERKVTGSMVSTLRKNALIPATLYGKGLDSINLSVKSKDFKGILEKAGFTQFIDLTFGDKKSRVLVKNVQIHPISRDILNVEFYQIDMKSEITTEVPIIFKGETIAEKTKIGLLIENLDSVDIRCLPADLPENIEIDVSVLAEIGQSILIKDIKLPEGVEIEPGVDQNQAIAMIVPPQMEEKVEEREEGLSPDEVEIEGKGLDEDVDNESGDDDDGDESEKKPDTKTSEETEKTDK